MNTSISSLSRLSDDELSGELRRLVLQERRASAAVLFRLAEFDARRLYLGAGFSSLFGYCTGALGFSEQSAYNRIEAARAARKFPVILELLGRGDVTLTSLRLLAPHLTPENHESLLTDASGKSRLQVEELLATRFPRPPVPPSVRKLPVPSVPAPGFARSVELRPARRPVVAPLSSDHYKITFTAPAATWRKLRQAQELLRHQVPDGDLAEIFDRALATLLEHLTRRKFAAVRGARSSEAARADASSDGPAARDVPAAAGRHIPADIRRAVWQRDGGSCAFISADGRRCGERGFVEFHHLRPFAVDGAPTASNIALRCRRHNGYEADLYFGPIRRYAAERPPLEGAHVRATAAARAP